MLLYKNCSSVTREFYGISFPPGSVRAVSGPIFVPGMVRVNSSIEQRVTIDTHTARKVTSSKSVKSDTTKKATKGGNT